MKKIIVLALCLLITASVAASQVEALTTTTPTVAPSPTTNQSVSQALDNQIKQLKDKVASRVAQLNLVEKKAIIGKVSDVASNQITMTDLQGKTRFIDVDEITKFSSPASKTFGLSDLKKGTTVSVLGTYNKDSGRILARFINAATIPVFITGAVSNIDKVNYYLTVTTEDQKQVKLNIESTSKINVSSDQGITRYGFSKVTIGDRAFAIGYPDKTDPTLINASRVIDLITLPKDPKIMVAAPSSLTTPSPTTKSSQ
jgi:hypothetical protein